MPEHASTSLLIMAGGRATRLGGIRKTLVQVGGRPIIERIVEALAPLADDCLALVHDADLPSIERLAVVVDPRPYAGPMPALRHGLRSASGDVCMLVAGDMPFVSSAAFTYLMQVRAEEQARVVVPFIDGHIESMHAVFARRELLDALTTAEEAGEQRLFIVFQTLSARLVEADELRTVDPDLHTLFNVNSPDDLALAEQSAADQDASTKRSRPA
jgi:molybdopterin-guanine dinucleotide biosynthesis protein A